MRVLRCGEDVRRTWSRAVLASGTRSSAPVELPLRAMQCVAQGLFPSESRAHISAVYERQQKTIYYPVWKIGMIGNKTKVLK